MRASLQEMRMHLEECPGGREINLLCGHCEFRTTSWPAMCAYLNQRYRKKLLADLSIE